MIATGEVTKWLTASLAEDLGLPSMTQKIYHNFCNSICWRYNASSWLFQILKPYLGYQLIQYYTHTHKQQVSKCFKHKTSIKQCCFVVLIVPLRCTSQCLGNYILIYGRYNTFRNRQVITEKFKPGVEENAL